MGIFSLKALKVAAPYAIKWAPKAWKWIRRGKKAKTVVDKTMQVADVVNQIETIKAGGDMSKFLSRKFLVTMTSFLVTVLGSFMAPEAVAEIERILMAAIALVSVYVGSQAVVDGVEKKKDNK